MAQFFGQEDIKELSKTSQTELEWAAGSDLRIGGQAYLIETVLPLDTATDIDTGAISNDTIYYVYATVDNFGAVSLTYSLSSSAPTGFDAYRKIGAFGSDDSAEITGTSVQDYGSVGDIIQSMLSEENFIEQNGAGWVLANGRPVAGSKYAALIGANIPDLRGRFLRGRDYGPGANPDGDQVLGTTNGHKTAPNGMSASVSGNTGGESASHQHSTNQSDIYGGGTISYPGWTDNVAGAGRSGGTGGTSPNLSGHTHAFSASGSVSGGNNETAPVNVIVNYFIKIEDIAI